MPNHRIPIRCHQYGAAARLQDAERLGKNAIDIGHVLRDLGADNDVERSIGLRDLRCISNRI